MDSGRRSARESEPSRRALLAALGSGSLAPVAGCLTADRATTETEPPDAPTATATEATDETPTSEPGGATIEPVGETWDEGGPPDRSNWTVTFQDAFDAGELDWDVWEVGFGPYNDHSCAGSACARRENVRVDADADRLVLETTPEGADEIPNSTWLADYTTGAVTTGTDFAQTYGYFEAKAKLPVQPGSLPAFWAWSADGNPPEIDFYESFGAKPSRLATTMHGECDSDEPLEGNGALVELSTRIDERFHVYGCAWTPEGVAFYVDGRQRHRVSADWLAACHDPEPLFPILNTHVVGGEDDFVGPDEVGRPEDADYPYTHEFDWVRVWQRDDLA